MLPIQLAILRSARLWDKHDVRMSRHRTLTTGEVRNTVSPMSGIGTHASAVNAERRSPGAGAYLAAPWGT